MDAQFIPVSGANPPYMPSPKIATDSLPTDSQAAAAASQQIPATPAAQPVSADSQYETSVRQAALSFKNVYALSDQQFSIFKDATGKYITRYVSLRDGRITYLPEPVFVKQLANVSASSARIAINA